MSGKPDESHDLRWFEAYPKCRCGKPSNGILRGSSNQSFGHHCVRCAEKRLKDSKKVRDYNAKLFDSNTSNPKDTPNDR